MTTRDEAEGALARVLLERVRQDKHPSTTHMTLLEQSLPSPLVREYLNVLLEKVLTDPSPSIPMIRRIQRVAGQLPPMPASNRQS
jgi:hypothetical protein